MTDIFSQGTYKVKCDRFSRKERKPCWTLDSVAHFSPQPTCIVPASQLLLDRDRVNVSYFFFFALLPTPPPFLLFFLFFFSLHSYSPILTLTPRPLPPLFPSTNNNSTGKQTHQPTFTHTPSLTQCPQQSRLSPVNTVPAAPSARELTPSSKVRLHFLHPHCSSLFIHGKPATFQQPTLTPNSRAQLTPLLPSFFPYVVCVRVCLLSTTITPFVNSTTSSFTSTLCSFAEAVHVSFLSFALVEPIPVFMSSSWELS